MGWRVGWNAPPPDTIGVYAEAIDEAPLGEGAIIPESWSRCK